MSSNAVNIDGGPAASNSTDPTFPAPPDQPPTVTVVPPTGRVVAGTAASFNVNAFQGVHFFWIPADLSYGEEPIVSYTETHVLVDNVDVIRDHRPGGGGIEAVTFSTPGNHTVSAFCLTADGQTITSAPVTVHVAAAGPPVFTLTSPPAGTVVGLAESGGAVTVGLSMDAEQFYPVSVSIGFDGTSTPPDQFNGGSYSRTVTIGAMPLGPRTLTVSCADRDGLTSTQTITVTGKDIAPPHPTVDFPQPGASVVGDATGAKTVPMHGTAVDAQIGMVGGAAGVAWSLTPDGVRTPAQALTGNDFSNWHADVPLVGFGAHTIHVWATDQAGNTTADPLSVPVVVISSFTPSTLDERLDEREYLAALLSFAQEEVSIPGPSPSPVDTQTLVGVLGQPVDRLSQPLSSTADRGNLEINQLRVPIELLRSHLSATNTSTAPGAAGEAAYRTAAYNALLGATGTSYPELRLVRGADATTRQALAARLGIRLSAATPDELDLLTLDGPGLTEAALESVFGLAATTAADPLRAIPTSQLLTLQLTGLTLSWADEDRHPNPPRGFAVLVDPDVIGAADVIATGAGDPVRALLTARATELSTFANQLNTTRTGAADAAHGLSALLAQVLPGVDLADWAGKQAQGTDIGGLLAGVGLTRAGFLLLGTVSRLAAAGPLTEAEWADTIAVLTSVHKFSVVATWTGQENALVLSPDYFVLSDGGPQVNPYRADGQARNGWQAVLRSRIAQRQDLVDGSARAVAAAEQLALPILRDALLADVDPAGTGQPGEDLSALFLVDMLAGGTLRTTRLRQAIESVQSLLSAKRSGELAPNHPAFAWIMNDPVAFSNAWVWLSELGAWQAATMAFLFPERHLDPTLLLLPDAQPSPALLALFDQIRGSGPFSGADAIARSADYLKAVGVPATVSYLDAHRSLDHQKALRDLSKGGTAQSSRETYWAVPMLLAQRLQSAGDFQSALDWFWILYPYDLDTHISCYDVLNTEQPFRPDLTIPPQWTSMLDPFALVANRPTPYTRYTLMSIIRCHIDFADAEFSRETDESIANARTLYVNARRLLNAPALAPQLPTNPGEPALAIPELDALRNRAEVQLAKLRQGRNIAGLPRTQPTSGTLTVSQPTPYRFKVLMDRARQLAAQATQMEAGYLAALEKYDEKNLQIFDAIKGVDLSAAQVTVATSRVQEANDAVTAATAQQTKADVTAAALATRIGAPPNQYESDLLSEYGDLRDVRDGIAVADTTIGVLQAASSASGLVDEVTSFGSKGVLAVGIAAATAVKGGLTIQQDNLDAQIQANQLQAGIEQRKDEWRLQLVGSQQDSLIAAAQVVTATDQVTIASQERDIATLQRDQAAASLKFLNDQFTNPDLYLWLSNTLGAVYRYFLQQATATARLAQAQLAFERAEPAQVIIRNDYWQSPAAASTVVSQPGRRGLTGAEQLAEDLAQLDDYAFRTERRRLNLSQTFSLARLMPVEFLEFRRTGVLSFATPMALFDADFPGHYLRLVRQVRTSVAALMPPDRGMRATLRSNGISRVVTGQDGTFTGVVVRHDPGLVALTAPVNGTGVFELDAQSDMLLPFESSGVDTTWELELPPAANPFDFASIVDVLFTIEYTALSDDGYRSQLTTQLNRNRQRGSDCVFSLSRDFPDQWYDLNNPADPTARSVTITLRDVDFPVGISGLATTAVAVGLSGPGATTPTTVSLQRGTDGGAATTSNGIASTRRGNAASWAPLYGSSPVGDWQLSFGADAAAQFQPGQLDDIVLVISWTGQSPLWT
jgi:hypothetical protein